MIRALLISAAIVAAAGTVHGASPDDTSETVEHHADPALKAVKTISIVIRDGRFEVAPRPHPPLIGRTQSGNPPPGKFVPLRKPVLVKREPDA